MFKLRCSFFYDESSVVMSIHKTSLHKSHFLVGKQKKKHIYFDDTQFKDISLLFIKFFHFISVQLVEINKHTPTNLLRQLFWCIIVV